MELRVLFMTQVFRPEMGALSNRLYPITRHLASRGHEVFVATGMPNYPRGHVFAAYRGKRFMREDVDGATVLRTAYLTTPRNVSKVSQLLSYVSFLPAVMHSGFRAGRVDVVFVTSPPLFPAAPAILLAKLRRARLVVDLRDLWPDELVACGAASEGALSVRLMRALEAWAYRAADLVTCTTAAFVETVRGRGVPQAKSRLLPNGADLEVFRPLPRDNQFANELGLGDRFVVMYSGLLGIKHGLETILEAAAQVRDDEQIAFVIVGDGPRREALTRKAKELELDNVSFLGERPAEQLPLLLARADVCVTTLLDEPYLEKIIPAKVFEYMACAKPVIGGIAGEGARVLEESGGGIVVAPGDAAAMADAIFELRASPERRLALGESGRRHVEEHYSRAVTAAQLEAMLVSLMSGTEPAHDAALGRLPM
jgi:colanic acid biosynthesis glycosyl transferase WcaI